VPFNHIQLYAMESSPHSVQLTNHKVIKNRNHQQNTNMFCYCFC